MVLVDKDPVSRLCFHPKLATATVEDDGQTVKFFCSIKKTISKKHTRLGGVKSMDSSFKMGKKRQMRK